MERSLLLLQLYLSKGAYKLDLNKYDIERRYIDKRSNVRPGSLLTTGDPVFFVGHDTGNLGATADNHFTYFQNLVDRSASAQVFIDDKKILEIIPTGTGQDRAEKAWHVLYNVTTDNERFGYNANDVALGIELCYGGNINFAEAYKRFVWYLAYCCKKWGKNPLIHIASHKQLDPSRKIDCDNALKLGGKTLKDLIYDVKSEMQDTVVAPVDFTPLTTYVATALIDNYVRPAWKKAYDLKQEPEALHFNRLADNLRSAAGVDEKLTPLAGAIKLHKSNAQELIVRWLSPAWHVAKSKGDQTGMTHFNNLANHLRAAAGMPIE